MVRKELIADIVEELVRVIPDGEKELDGDDLDCVENVVGVVCSNAADAIDEVEDTEDAEELKA